MLPARLELLRKQGHDTSWYERCKIGGQVKNFSRRELKAKVCNYLSAKLVEYREGEAKIHTVTTSGEKYALVRTEPTLKNGDPRYWCTACGLICEDWAGYLGHFKKGEA